MPRVKLTKPFVENAKAEAGRERSVFWDKSMRGLGLVVTKAGAKSFVYQYRASGSSRRMNLNGSFLRQEAERETRNGGKARVLPSSASPLGAARREAAKVRNALLDGRDPLAERLDERRKVEAAASDTLAALWKTYMALEGKKLRSAGQRERIFSVYISPEFGARQISDIKRSHITKLLDRVEVENGPVMSHAVLGVLRRLMTWHANRGDEYASPIGRGMGRIKPKERARDRTLEDHELRAVWRAAESLQSPYGYLARFLLLTTVRLREAAWMTRSELSTDGSTWTIPGKRHKSKRDFLVPLNRATRDLLADMPAIGQKWVFSFDGRKPINDFSGGKAALDARVLVILREQDPNAEPLPRWVFHDLRRTGRSLMSRCGVPSRHAEMAMGHTIRGVEATYDRFHYRGEKAAALEALAAQIGRILEPSPNVVPMRSAG